MNRHDSRYHSARPARNRPSAVLIPLTPRLQVLSETFEVHVESSLIDIHILGICTRLRNSFGGCNECIRNCEDAVARTHARSHEPKTQCIGTAPHTDAELDVTELGERALKVQHCPPANEGR